MKKQDKMGICLWFHNYRLCKRGDQILPSLKLDRDVWPYEQGMEKWSFEKLETWVYGKMMDSCDEWNPCIRELKDLIEGGREIKVIEIVNYSKGWVMPIAREHKKDRNGKRANDRSTIESNDHPEKDRKKENKEKEKEVD